MSKGPKLVACFFSPEEKKMNYTGPELVTSFDESKGYIEIKLQERTQTKETER